MLHVFLPSLSPAWCHLQGSQCTLHIAGLLLLLAGKGDVIRLVPPLVVTKEEIRKCAEVLALALQKVSASTGH
jgi:acetylornithine/succinyldiaminopimelate/putrescine aminotransferase